MALNINAAAPRTPSELGVLPRSDGNAGLTVKLLEFLKDDRSRGHIDAQRQSFGREHRFDQLPLKELFYDLFKCWQHSGVVGGNSALKAIQPVPIAEDGKVLIEKGAAARFNNLANLVTFLRCSQANPCPENLIHGLIAAHAAENKENCGHEVLGVQHCDDIRAIHSGAGGSTATRLITVAVFAIAHALGASAKPCHLYEFGIYTV